MSIYDFENVAAAQDAYQLTKSKFKDNVIDENKVNEREFIAFQAVKKYAMNYSHAITYKTSLDEAEKFLGYAACSYSKSKNKEKNYFFIISKMLEDKAYKHIWHSQISKFICEESIDNPHRPLHETADAVAEGFLKFLCVFNEDDENDRFYGS